MESLKRALASPAATLIGWLALALSIYPTLWGKDGTATFKLDAWIYHHAVAQWHAGGSLYDWYANPDQQLWPFTYPPFAAWALTPLTWWPDRATQVALVVATPVCTAITAGAVLHALGAERRVAWGGAPWLALVAVLALEPIPKTMEYGQINAVLMMLVALDLLVVPPSSRLRGVLAGLAAAFKLTPAIAVLIFLARREWRATATMIGSALGVTALSWLASPQESAQFFFSAMWDSSRAGFTDYSGNQNLKGLVARWLPTQTWDGVWAVLAAAAVMAAWLLLVRLNRLREAAVPAPVDAGSPTGSTTPTLVPCRRLPAARRRGPGAADVGSDDAGAADLADLLVAPLGVVPARSHGARGCGRGVGVAGAADDRGDGRGGVRPGHAVVVPGAEPRRAGLAVLGDSGGLVLHVVGAGRRCSPVARGRPPDQPTSARYFDRPRRADSWVNRSPRPLPAPALPRRRRVRRMNTCRLPTSSAPPRTSSTVTRSPCSGAAAGARG
ncbi:glycosyltransferase family 87 protein [Actinomyces ruminis]|uniref:glycosyltransferase family 87 protein n=1 Tax=Actinomyces ruminis TaxID=1937003 RepID=UPI0023EE36AE|nr:glycosyltransferase family 87 protein [Actinomyces ruminis]